MLFRLDMYQRQAVDEDGHVVARVVIARSLLILVEHLQAVIVDVLFVQQEMFLDAPLSCRSTCT